MCPCSKTQEVSIIVKNRDSPVFSLISHKTENRAGFILWQFKVCFLKKKKEKEKRYNSNDNKYLIKSLLDIIIVQYLL